MSLSTKPLIICTDSPGWGGAEITLTRLLRIAADYSVSIVCSRQVGSQLKDYVQARQITTLTLKSRGNSARDMAYGLYQAFRLIGEHRNAFFMIWAHHPDSNRWLQCALALTNRDFAIAERIVPAGKHDFAQSRLSLPLKRFTTSKARIIILNSYSQQRHYQEMFQLKEEVRDRVIVIPNSRNIRHIRTEISRLRTDRKKLRASLGLADEATILCLARLEDQKDQKTLIRAIARLANTAIHTQLVLVGDGAKRRDLETLASQLVPAQVIFTGQQADPLPWLAAADIFVLPSLYEGLPGALIEALAASLPCVATNIPGNRELVIDEDTGLLVPVEDPVRLAGAVERLLLDSTLRQRLADQGSQLVLRKYDEEIEEQAWRKLLDEGALGTAS